MAKLTFREPTGFYFRHRGVGFLEGEGWLNAGSVFEELSEEDERAIRDRIDHWLDGRIHDKYHHGFPNDPRHDQCYVFKYQTLRLYGFLCNPKLTDHGYRLCVLTEAVRKYQWNTEPAILDRAMRMLNDQQATYAIAVTYKGYRGGKTWWKN